MSADEPISRYGLTTVNDDPETIAGEPAEIDRALELIGKAVDFAQNVKKFIPGGKLANQFLTAVNVIFEKRNYIQQNEILSIQLRAKVAIGLKILAEESERLEGLQFAKDATKTYLSALKEVEVTLKSLDRKNGMRQLIGQATWNFVNSDQVTKKFKGLEAKLDSAYDDLRSARELYMAQKISQVAEMGGEILIANQKTQEKVNLLLTELRKASLEIGVLDISSLAGGAALGENTRERLTLKRTEILYENNEEVRGKRGQVVKTLLKPAEEVAMIKRARIMPPEEEREKSFWLEAAIAHYLRYNKYISAFRGVIDHNGDHYMIYDWAEHGDLSAYLEKHKDLCWKLKLKIAYQVASGLSYCHKREIVHHNVRSKSVLLDDNLDAKLANFELSRNEEANSKELADDSIERYTAPEKVYNYDDRAAEKRYTKQCDVFSFGLLLWELAEHTKPYPEIENNRLVASIYRKGERPEIKKSGMPAGYRDIMERAWRQEPFARPEMAEISRDLYIMLQNYRSADPDSLPPSPQFEPSDTESSTSIDELTNTPTLKSALELEKQKKYDEAFSIFHSHALKDGIAQYKIGFYFFYGEPYTTSKNLTESEKYLKMSADSGNADAQYLLFQLLLEQAIAQKKKPYIAEAYLKMAVDQRHPDALLAYGQHCLKHTFGHLDNIKGLGCLMLALFAWVFGDRSKDRQRSGN